MTENTNNPIAVYNAIERVIKRNWGVTIDQLFAPDRHREIVDRRRSAIYSFCELTDGSATTAARFFHRSRCDILHLYKTAQEFRKTDAYFVDMCEMFINATKKELTTK